MNNQKTSQNLQAKIAQLEKENSQLKASFYQIINLAHQAVNNQKSSRPEPDFNFFGSGCSKCHKNHVNLEQVFKFLNGLNSQAKQAKTNQANECFFGNFKDFKESHE